VVELRRGCGVADPTGEFFETLEERGHGALPGEARGTVRFDVTRDTGTEHWYVDIHSDGISVSHTGKDPADSVVQTDRHTCDLLVTGATTIVAAILRNRVRVQGNLLLILAFRQFFPDAPGARDPRVAGRAR